MSRADRQWNNWDGGATASMGKCKSAGSLNNRGPPHDPRRKTLTRTYEFTLTTTLTQATQSAAILDGAPRDQAERRKTTPAHEPCWKRQHVTTEKKHKEAKCRGKGAKARNNPKT